MYLSYRMPANEGIDDLKSSPLVDQLGQGLLHVAYLV